MQKRLRQRAVIAEVDSSAFVTQLLCLQWSFRLHISISRRTRTCHVIIWLNDGHPMTWLTGSMHRNSLSDLFSAPLSPSPTGLLARHWGPFHTSMVHPAATTGTFYTPLPCLLTARQKLDHIGALQTALCTRTEVLASSPRAKRSWNPHC